MGTTRLVAVLMMTCFWLLALAGCTGSTETSHEPTISDVNYLVMEVVSGHESDAFGASLASNDRYLFVGAIGRTVGGERLAGAVDVFSREPDGLSPVTTLEAPMAHEAMQWGTSLAATESWLAIGCPHCNRGPASSGAVWIYRIAADGEFSVVEVIEPPQGQERGRFGAWLAMDEESLLIREDMPDDRGRVYVLPLNSRSDGLKVIMQGQQAYEMVGNRMILLDRSAVISSREGINEHGNLTGTVHFLDRNDWKVQQTIAPSALEDGAGFGHAMAYDGQRLAIAFAEYGANGTVQVVAFYEWKASESRWSYQRAQKGSDGVGLYSDAMTWAGHRLWVGSPAFDAADTDARPGIDSFEPQESRIARVRIDGPALEDRDFGYVLEGWGSELIVSSVAPPKPGASASRIYVLDADETTAPQFWL